MSGDPQLATEEAARYVAHHYVPSQTPSDYRFLFDLVAQRFGHATLEELLTIEARKRPDTIAALVEIPRLIQILTWVALQRDAPAARLLIALYRVDKRRTAINLEELADGLDEEMELSSGPGSHSSSDAAPSSRSSSRGVAATATTTRTLQSDSTWTTAWQSWSGS